MKKKANGTKRNIMIVLFVLMAASLAGYFMFRDNYDWVANVVPEIVGASMIGITITYALRANTKIKKFIFVYSLIFVLAIVGFVYGYCNDIRFLEDVMPEFIGGTVIGLILSLLFRRRLNL